VNCGSRSGGSSGRLESSLEIPFPATPRAEGKVAGGRSSGRFSPKEVTFMSKRAIPFILSLGVLGCAGPQQGPAPTTTNSEADKAEFRKLQESVSRLENRLGHLESEVSAASAENELTSMTIDSAAWADSPTAHVFGSKNALVCHVVEWRGYGKMLRFTRMADPRFVLESDGHPSVEAQMATGGICGSDGKVRSVVLNISQPLDSGARYHLRPLNQIERYHWSVPADFQFTGVDVEGEQPDSNPLGSRKLGPGSHTK
jgi:hypothetical protein